MCDAIAPGNPLQRPATYKVEYYRTPLDISPVLPPEGGNLRWKRDAMLPYRGP
jgi:hypothetical protein